MSEQNTSIPDVLLVRSTLLGSAIALQDHRAVITRHMANCAKPIFFDLTYHAGTIGNKIQLGTYPLDDLPEEYRQKLTDILQYMFDTAAGLKLKYSEEKEEVDRQIAALHLGKGDE